MANQQSTLVGVVEELWRYPVKSMLGEQLTASDVAECGLLGDRTYALRDISDSKIATAKNPRKWPNLFDYSATLTSAPRANEKPPSARITLPNGTTISTEQPDAARILSAALKREIKPSSKRPATRPTTKPPKSIGSIWTASNTATPSPNSTCPLALSSTPRPSTS